AQRRLLLIPQGSGEETMAVFDGSPGNDQYFGTAQADRIEGYDGQDQLRGGGGNDTIHGGNGPDSLYGDQGDDEIVGGAGDDVVRGGRESDTIFGDGGIDVLFGDRDNDFLFGGEGDDILLGGPGDDEIVGGAGADYINGGDGIDSVSYADSPVGRSGDGVLVDLYFPGFGIDGDAQGDVLIEIEKVIGSPGNDDLRAAYNDSSDSLFGGSGNDKLVGGGFEHHPADYLDGGPGDDRLQTVGHGTVVGGPGKDVFDYLGEFYGGEIKDFTKGEDRIGFVFASDVNEADLDNMLRNSSGNVLSLSLLGPEFESFGDLTINVPVSTLDASDFII
ncbi:MAG: calcium-binding protein, partial [Rhodospirillaceae bacterium]|nr:calcium-binding protein [Rhodospirillaceae bacterium]